jgi:hypothetical protein
LQRYVLGAVWALQLSSNAFNSKGKLCLILVMKSIMMA